MKKKYIFKSIYFKFAVIFLGIWWGLNSMAFGLIFRIMSATGLFSELGTDMHGIAGKLEMVRKQTGEVFFFTAVLGTIIILFTVRSIVKPIKCLSAASKEVAKGNFNIEIPIKSGDEIGRLSGDFNIMIEELKSIDTLRSEFVDNVSHEFRTPVTSIKGFAKLLRDNELDNQTRMEYCETMINESERLMGLSSNLLRLSQIEHQVIWEKTTFSLDDQIRDAVIFLEPQWSKKEIEFDLNLEPMQFLGDEQLLWQVWINLLQNAVKFSHQNGLITINLQRWNNGVRMKMRDNGIGISEADKKYIFDRFYKGDKARNSSGNGLGLVIVKKIIDSMGGVITVESELEKGTEFTVELTYD